MIKQLEDIGLPSYCGWMGSKSGQAESILIPRLHPMAYENYVEMFAGGSGLFFRKQQATQQSILNDIDPDVINMHTCIAGQVDDVMAAIKRMRSSRTTFEEVKRLRNSASWWDLPGHERAARMIYLVKNSFNGNMHTYSISAKYASTYNPEYDLRPHARKLKKVQFECQHWKDLLHRIVFKPKTARLFLYADPPYIAAIKADYYRFNFDALEHIVLARELCRVNEFNQSGSHDVRIMISYDDDQDGLIRSLYRPEFGWWIEPVEVEYESENHGQAWRELVITNYPSPGAALRNN